MRSSVYKPKSGSARLDCVVLVRDVTFDAEQFLVMLVLNGCECISLTVNTSQAVAQLEASTAINAGLDDTTQGRLRPTACAADTNPPGTCARVSNW
jgi:hypothetical protein